MKRHLLGLFDNPTAFGAVWSLVSLVVMLGVLGIVVYLIVRALRRGGGGKVLGMVLVCGVLAAGCMKEPQDSRQELLREMGFNMATVQVRELRREEAAMVFSSVAEARAFFRGVGEGVTTTGIVKEMVGEREPEDYLPGDPVPNFVTLQEVFLWSGHNISFIWVYSANPNGGPITVSNMKSFLTGLTYGQTWTQQQATWWNYPGSALIYYQVLGSQSYGVSVSGFNNMITDAVIIQGWYNTETKKYTSTAYWAGRQPVLN